MQEPKYRSGDLVRLVTDASPQMAVGVKMAEPAADGSPAYMVVWFSPDAKLHTAVLPESCLVRAN